MKTRSGTVNISKTGLSPSKLTVEVKQVKDAKLPYYSLITVAVAPSSNIQYLNSFCQMFNRKKRRNIANTDKLSEHSALKNCLKSHVDYHNYNC